MSGLSHWFGRLSTTTKLLVILSAAILPLGLVLVWAATTSINRANQALVISAEDRSRSAGRAVESLLARNVLALRVAATGALRDGSGDPCALARQSLSSSVGVVRTFALQDPGGQLLCTAGTILPQEDRILVPPGQVRLWISPTGNMLYYRVGVPGGIGTGTLSREELRDAALISSRTLRQLTLSDGRTSMLLIDEAGAVQAADRDPNMQLVERRWMIGGGQLSASSIAQVDRIGTSERGLILLPLLMWIVATLLSWLLVGSFLIRPLRRMQRAIGSYQPGSAALELPERLGSATEIRELGQSFSRAVERIEESERDMAVALEGQRRLVREVHHRVKNNLQVIASLLNIHSRLTAAPEARNAYASIGRRVDALAVVHRNHYAELEENRGISLRPLISELAASLRSSAPDTARRFNIDLELDSLNTTQDAAVAVAFFTTEVVECAMLGHPEDAIRLTLSRIDDVRARYTITAAMLQPDTLGERPQFERIITGLAKQLRSPLEREMGSYSVILPVFPSRSEKN
ncbi:sensor histidine kinase [Sphingomonas sp. BN140010]|uniref:histidine kinase n=1 Tax=Sphingomonas arvum TaxID=2992113 RepID=A0ABT3JGY7_9SPHN|nr:sensor histidine kinase [Sphingomonas sp. BN140010]MCW3798352.1 sensor histidine kinase [Sphingomonas sp. BN140010]